MSFTLTNPGSEHTRHLTADLRVIMIVGATATGKTGLSLALANHLPVEIINADSRYLYRGMDIGTAKPTPEERAVVPHHLVDILDPNQSFSLAQFLDRGYQAIEEVGNSGSLPLVVGGTPLYLRALYEGWRTPEAPPDEDLRSRLGARDPGALYEMLRDVDPASAERIGPTNARRLIRALEVFEVTGRPMSELEGKDPPPYNWLVIGLYRDREELHERIATRARWMFENGLLDEARALQHLDPQIPALSAIGYREAIDVVNGNLDLESAVEQTIYSTNRYLRHQTTWFRKFPDVEWFDAGGDSLVEDVLKSIQSRLDVTPKTIEPPKA